MAIASDWISVVIVVLAAAFVGVIAWQLLSRLRAHRRQITAELTNSPVFADDRAFNQIRMARGELDLLRREGLAVPRAAELLAQADSALARRENVQAVRLAHEAHDLLVAARAGPAGPPAVPGAEAAAPPEGRISNLDRSVRSSRSAAPASGSSGAEGDEAARPPKNRMEAHFQMTLLVEELQRRDEPADRPPGWPEAESLRGAAQSAYADGQYTEALRLALRGRRALGAQLETLPPARPGVAPRGAAEGPTSAATSPRVASMSGATCGRCGKSVQPDDRFCRSCGASRSAATCPRCSGPVGPADTFCGVCGSPLA